MSGEPPGSPGVTTGTLRLLPLFKATAPLQRCGREEMERVRRSLQQIGDRDRIGYGPLVNDAGLARLGVDDQITSPVLMVGSKVIRYLRWAAVDRFSLMPLSRIEGIVAIRPNLQPRIAEADGTLIVRDA